MHAVPLFLIVVEGKGYLPAGGGAPLCVLLAACYFGFCTCNTARGYHLNLLNYMIILDTAFGKAATQKIITR